MLKRGIGRGFGLVFLVLLLGAPTWAGERGPQETVRKYLTALQERNFGEAYEYVSEGMRGGKSKDEWVKEQKYIFDMSEAKILDFKVFPAKVEGEEATVPNILSSQDKFLNQLGVEEYELYTLVRENGEWKIDQQRLVIQDSKQEKWFPEDALEGDKSSGPKKETLQES